jgi:hypothetical protein
MGIENMQKTDFSVLTSELSPAVVIECHRPEVTLFANLELWGLGAPTRVSFVTKSGVQVRRRAAGESLKIDPKFLTEAWMLCWFDGARGWEWESPWLVVWQHRPTLITLSEKGVKGIADVPLGDIALMPLYGVLKSKPKTGYEKDCRLWAQRLRRYPVKVAETSKIAPETNSIIFRSVFTYKSIDDDWKTPAVLFAPLSPTLALAQQSAKMPMRFAKGSPEKTSVETGFGPYIGVSGENSYEISFPLLNYITETEQEPTKIENAVAKRALDRLVKTCENVFNATDGRYHPDFGDPEGYSKGNGNDGNTVYAAITVQYPCRAIPYLPVALQEKVKTRLRAYFSDWLLQEKRFKPYQGKLLFVGPGVGEFGHYDDAGKFSSNLLLSLYYYARYTGDWELVKARWELVKRLFVTPRECRWRSFGRQEVAEMGDEAAPVLAMARMAWFVGDKEMFAYAASLYVRELTHHVVKCTGGEYFTRLHPLHTAMPPRGTVYPTNVLGDMIGWDGDGREWATLSGTDKQWVNRWVRFADPDVARFHRDHLAQETRTEMAELLEKPEVPPRPEHTCDDAHIRPSRMRLRSLLLNETPEELNRITPVEAPIYPDSGAMAHCMAYLRTIKPITLTPLLPLKQTSSDWVRGIEREGLEGDAVLTVVLSHEKHGPPALTWGAWKPPQENGNISGGKRWSFGQIQTDKPVESWRQERVSWNTVRTLFGS